MDTIIYPHWKPHQLGLFKADSLENIRHLSLYFFDRAVSGFESYWAYLPRNAVTIHLNLELGLTGVKKLTTRNSSYCGYKVGGRRFPSGFNTESVILNPTKMTVLPNYNTKPKTRYRIEKFELAFSRPPWSNTKTDMCEQSKFPFFLVYVDANLPEIVDIDTTSPMTTKCS
ncbi:unnamed protein product [Ambrosiozyma monospora]|uniref:Unnamed protein product n=1 Tax=Ambrosiozyma monospora TaxID=43982 RepID=A0ACB5T993_AMBMO|nr:unnamed protein product [Ambrosiozyma monospora]